MFKIIAENKRNTPQRVTLTEYKDFEEAFDNAMETFEILKKFGTIIWIADENGNEIGIA